MADDLISSAMVGPTFADCGHRVIALMAFRPSFSLSVTRYFSILCRDRRSGRWW